MKKKEKKVTTFFFPFHRFFSKLKKSCFKFFSRNDPSKEEFNLPPKSKKKKEKRIEEKRREEGRKKGIKK